MYNKHFVLLLFVNFHSINTNYFNRKFEEKKKSQTKKKNYPSLKKKSTLNRKSNSMNERSIFFLLFSDACRLNPLKGIYLTRKIKKRTWISHCKCTFCKAKYEQIRSTIHTKCRYFGERLQIERIWRDNQETEKETEFWGIKEWNRKCLQASQLAGV